MVFVMKYSLDNIHLIFSNFLNIHNLLYKQVVQHHNGLKNIIAEVQNSSSDVHNRKKEIRFSKSNIRTT